MLSYLLSLRSRVAGEAISPFHHGLYILPRLIGGLTQIYYLLLSALRPAFKLPASPIVTFFDHRIRRSLEAKALAKVSGEEGGGGDWTFSFS